MKTSSIAFAVMGAAVVAQNQLFSRSGFSDNQILTMIGNSRYGNGFDNVANNPMMQMLIAQNNNLNLGGNSYNNTNFEVPMLVNQLRSGRGYTKEKDVFNALMMSDTGAGMDGNQLLKASMAATMNGESSGIANLLPVLALANEDAFNSMSVSDYLPWMMTNQMNNDVVGFYSAAPMYSIAPPLHPSAPAKPTFNYEAPTVNNVPGFGYSNYGYGYNRLNNGYYNGYNGFGANPFGASYNNYAANPYGAYNNYAANPYWG